MTVVFTMQRGHKQEDGRVPKLTITDMTGQTLPLRRMTGLAGRLGLRETQLQNGEWWPVLSLEDDLLTQMAAVWMALDAPLSAKVRAVMIFGILDLKYRIDTLWQVEL